jgi:5-methylcytosine-specific restriction endonuclease McrA
MKGWSRRKLDHSHRQWRAQGGCCWYCGANLFPSESRAANGGIHPRSASRDHIVAKSKGGTRRPRNIVLACIDCNRRKAAREVSEFVALLKQPIPTNKEQSE